MAAKKHVTFGSISLPIQQQTSPFIPQLLPYKEHGKVLETVAFAIQENMPVLLIGETGVGKTAAVRYIAAKTNNSLRRVNINGSMTAEDFVGQLLVNEKGTYWKDGVLIEAMRKGYWIVIDEINAASAEILFVLHSLLDDDRYVVLTDHPNREIVQAHPNFRVFATMNPPERYAGTKELNKALMSRFALTLTVPIPPPSIEYGVLSGAEDVLGDDSKKLRSFVDELRAAYNKEELEVFVSPRDVASIVKVYIFTASLIEAVRMTIAPRGTEAERKTILEMAKLHFLTKVEPVAIADKIEVGDTVRCIGEESTGGAGWEKGLEFEVKKIEFQIAWDAKNNKGVYLTHLELVKKGAVKKKAVRISAAKFAPPSAGLSGLSIV